MSLTSFRPTTNAYFLKQSSPIPPCPKTVTVARTKPALTKGVVYQATPIREDNQEKETHPTSASLKVCLT